MVTFWGVLVVLGVLLVGRYGADSRPGGDPSGRDPAWPDQPVRAHRTAWEAFDRSLRPWDTHA